MSHRARNIIVAALAAACLCALLASAQDLPIGGVGSGTNLTSIVYFDPPNDQIIRTRLTGAEMSPMPGALYRVKELKIENYSTNGAVDAVVRAPSCTYAPLDETASSAGPLELSLAKGHIHVKGEGFSWQQGKSLLVISNKQCTVIDMGSARLPIP